jgi:hypothetical protein
MANEQYMLPQSFGSSWSTPQGAEGIGGDGATTNVGEFVLRQPGQYMCTVTLTLRRLPGVNGGLIGWLYAEISAGIGAQAYTVEMDWANGQSITLPVLLTKGMSGVVTVNAKQVGFYGGPVALSASMVVGTRGGNRELPTWTTAVSLPAGAAPPVLIVAPRRSKTLFVPKQLMAGGAASDIVVTSEYLGQGPNARWDQAVAADSALWTTGVQLPPLCDQVRLVSAAGSVNPPDKVVNVIFGLDG